MITGLTQKDLLKLETLFVLPLVTQDMINGIEPMDEVAEYTFHEILSELRPDTALLCISLCCYHLSQNMGDGSAAKVLQMQSADMINEYGPLWLAHEAEDPDLNDIDVQKALTFIPEDIETMADLLDTVLGETEHNCETKRILCDIMSLQAHMHKDLALVELESIALEPSSRVDAEKQEKINELCTADNVVAFPVMSAARGQELFR